ncbi:MULTISPECIES: hypothetical protein [Listeria]|uniref:hypothetical protein n=1 Tax=Listeria TaxID=1637 RepID=UPI000B594A9C|nr:MULTISPECIES: hypothetical protein [Listeria]
MKETSNAYERVTYNQCIMQKENQIDLLGENQKEVEDLLYRLDEDLQTGFRRLRDLNDSQLKEVQSVFYQVQQRNEDLERRFRQQVRDTQEQFTYLFIKEIQKMNDEREALYKKRSEIPWD